MSSVSTSENATRLLPFSNDPKAAIQLGVDSDQTVSVNASNEYTDIEISQSYGFGQFVFISPEIRAYYTGFDSGYNQGYLKAFQDINVAAEEMISLQTEDELSELRNDIRTLTSTVVESTTDIKEKLAKLGEDVKYINSSIDAIQRDSKDLPALRVKIEHLENSSVWWKQYLLAPIATVVLGGVLLALAKYVFHLM